MLDEKDLKEIAHLMSVLIENEVTPKFNLLAEGQQVILDKLVSQGEMDDLESRIETLETAVKRHSREITELKKAN